MRSRTATVRVAMGLALILLAAMVPTSMAQGSGPQLVFPQPGQVVKGNPIFQWRDTGAASYTVDISQNGLVVYSTTTANNKLAPPIELPLGGLSWSVTASNGGTSRSNFQKISSNAPVLVTPESGATLEYPFDPPVFTWEPVTGAIAYTLEIDDAPNFINAVEIQTEGTHHVLTEAQPIGQTFHWRVTGILQNEVRTARSQVRSYRISWDAAPQLLGPINTTATHVEDVILEWQPVVGATTYEVQISPNADWANNVVFEAEVKSTRFSPPLLNNASYFWRVRAKDQTTNVTPWSEEWQFRRGWPDKPTAITPAPGSSVSTPEFSWTPVDHAAFYELQMSTDRSFSPASVREGASCKTDHTRFTFFQQQPCEPDPVTLVGGQTYFWRVRGIDAGTSINVDEPGILGIWSDPVSFTISGPPPTDGPVSGSVTYPAGAVDCATTPIPQEACVETPTLRWNYVPGAGSYAVYIALDPDFTNRVEEYERVTPFNSYTPPMSLLDNQAGESYYWFVQACESGATFESLAGCTPFDGSATQAARTFRKRSLPVKLISPIDEARVENQVTFTWEDYLKTNLDQGSTDGQKQYRIQVSTQRDFATKIDEAVVDHNTYTSFAKTYPEGPLYWRVQAIDNTGNNLTFSDKDEGGGADPGLIWRVVKASPPIELQSPNNRATLRGVSVFKWAPQPYAATYEIEIYRERDLQFSPVNLIASKVTQMTAWAPETALAPGRFSWRVRGLDADDQPRAWSEGRTFSVVPDAPTLVAPKRGGRVGDNPLFRWKGTAQAAEYQWIVATDVGLNNVVQSQQTVMTAWAPTSTFRTGTYYWAVRAVDSAGAVGPRSNVRSFVVGAPATGNANRSISLSLQGHLKVSGVITAVARRCRRGNVHIERFNGASWNKVKSIRSSRSGAFGTPIPDIFGNYRARIDRTVRDGRVCSAAISNVVRHRH